MSVHVFIFIVVVVSSSREGALDGSDHLHLLEPSLINPYVKDTTPIPSCL